MIRNDRSNLVVDLTTAFAFKVIKYTENLDRIRKFNLSNQLFRSGTSVGANVMEAQNAESKRDFIHKMKIAAKEADESYYWLFLCDNLESYPNCKQLLADLKIIIKVLSKIISTAKRK
ncbi:four helix bundle protein [Aureispira anguillae]|uniref:Four helix bundle protein n=1 Tax=Aureispira anguillae TaxID=2864201 RepID=A0A915YFE5_9BACT|nr:four helix bundle protein [Aureispira anguillae]BDS12113.1 four helix bundle protein [Aureispira anguillae]